MTDTECGSQIAACWPHLLDANWLSIGLANRTAVLPAATVLAAREATDHLLRAPFTLKLPPPSTPPPTPPPSVTVCGHVAPSGQTAWRMELCHFPDCFPGIVFLDVSAVLAEHYKSIKRSFLRFSSIPPVISCKTHQSADGKHCLSLQKSKQRCLSLSRDNACLTVSSCSMVAYIGWRSNCL